MESMRSLMRSWTTAPLKSNAAILAATLLFLLYIGFLMFSNFRNQVALRESALNRHRLHIEKRAAALGYFISERKYDLASIAGSREISNYFINKSLGISEQYGLRVSLFVIGEMFKKTTAGKLIQGDPIYERFLFFEQTGRLLVDTQPRETVDLSVFQRTVPEERSNEPDSAICPWNGRNVVFLTAPVLHKEQPVGRLVAWLNASTLCRHFVDFSLDTPEKNYHLATSDGQVVCPPGETACPFTRYIGSGDVPFLTPTGEINGLFGPGQHGSPNILVTTLPILNTPLYLVNWVQHEELLGASTPWETLVRMGLLTVIILVGIGALIRFNTMNLILGARVEESRRQQETLSLQNTQLEEEMNRRIKAEEELEQQRTLRMRSDRLRSLGEMAAGISHELNQPLVGIRGLAEMNLIHIEGNQSYPTCKIKKDLNVIIEQADRMVHIIKHVRMFAREAGKPDTRLVDLGDVVRSAMSLLNAQFKSHNIRLETELPQLLLRVRVNPFSLEEVIINLLANARDAVEKKRETMGHGYAPRIELKTRSAQEQGKAAVHLEVSDNGVGISSRLVDRIFDPFFTTKDPDKGTGLGLSICRAIVEDFGGYIQCRSVEGEGSTFAIVVPACAEEGEKDGFQDPENTRHR